MGTVFRDPKPTLLLPIVMLVALASAGCADKKIEVPTAVPDVAPGYLAGYLAADSVPDSLALLPPPPTADSVQATSDEVVYRTTRAMRDTPRWSLAAEDTQLQFPAAANIFSCALGMSVTDKMPHVIMLLRRSLADTGFATYRAKNHYQRSRPFVAHHQASCMPSDESRLIHDGSYPSGHASVGWGWALLLSELAPERADALLARGYAFGQSRVICGVHWQSDVDAGRLVGAAVVARLHADPVFRAEMELAKTELIAARAAPAAPVHDCQAEAAALAIR